MKVDGRCERAAKHSCGGGRDRRLCSPQMRHKCVYIKNYACSKRKTHWHPQCSGTRSGGGVDLQPLLHLRCSLASGVRVDPPTHSGLVSEQERIKKKYINRLNSHLTFCNRGTTLFNFREFFQCCLFRHLEV